MNIHAALMLKAPKPGFVKTRLAATIGPEAAAAAYRQLVETQIAHLPSWWQISIHFAPADDRALMESWLKPIAPRATYHPQCDGDLGERMNHAVNIEFQTNADAVVLLGGDCPYLTSPILHEAASSLHCHDLVIIPADDGGYVSLLLKAHHPQLFQNIAWSTPRVLQQTLATATSLNLTPHLFPPLEDIDDLTSWQRFQH